MIFKLCNDGKSVVGIIEDGVSVSYLIEAEEYQQWLAQGNVPEPEFTEEELNNNRIAEIKAEAGRIITERYPSFKQVNAQLGIYGAEYLATMTAFITDIKTQSDVLELDAAKTKNDFVVGA